MPLNAKIGKAPFQVVLMAGGRKIELIIDDTEAKPAVAMTKGRKLVEKDRVHVLIGGLMASTGYALKPYVDRKKIPA